jgi:myo-inositol-1(or 4)-monophosphatase
VSNIALSEIEALAREAGALLRAGYSREKHIYFKGAIDLVTDVDRQAEEFIIEKILTRHPGHRIVAEESGETAGEAGSTWYVDPMDGTVNFSHGFPVFCVSIGYAENGVMQCGVVYDPIRDECFCAERGCGAWLDGKPIHVSQNTDLNTSLLATELGYDVRTHPQNNLDLYSYFSLNTIGVRRIGSAALDLCYVACGRFDGYWELRVKPWDLAAGGLVAEEAGAMVSKITGELEYVTPPCSILAAPAGLHTQMQEIIDRHLR